MATCQLANKPVNKPINKPFINGKFEYIARYDINDFNHALYFSRDIKMNAHDLSYVGDADTIQLVAYYVNLTYCTTKHIGDLEQTAHIYRGNLTCILDHLTTVDSALYNMLFHVDKLRTIILHITANYVTISMLFDLLMAIKQMVQIAYCDKSLTRAPIVGRIITQIHHYIRTHARNRIQ